jgi:hypothetical protein
MGLAEGRIIDRGWEVFRLLQRSVREASGLEEHPTKPRVRDLPVVGAREQYPALCDDRQGGRGEHHVVVLGDESAPFRRREARWVENDDVEAVATLLRLR